MARIHCTQLGSFPKLVPVWSLSIKTLAENQVIVVVGYGGWDDAVMKALKEIVVDDSAQPEIIWTLHSKSSQPAAHVLEKLAPGIDRARVSFYSGIYCNTFFPALLTKWTKVAVKSDPSELKRRRKYVGRSGRDEDRPPLTEFCVGREKQLDDLTNMSQRACFITGMGGEGKSTIAARYFAVAQESGLFELCVWRDCKEEGERFENQLH